MSLLVLSFIANKLELIKGPVIFRSADLLFKSIFIVFIYGNLFYLPVQEGVFMFANLYLPGKIILSVFAALVFLALYFFKDFKKYTVCFFYFFLGITLFTTKIIDNNNSTIKNDSDLGQTFVTKNIQPSYNAYDSLKFFLIVLDEYSFEENQTNNELLNYLRSKGWVVKNKFKSNEQSTLASISSLFNYNQSYLFKNNELHAGSKKKMILARDLLENSALINDLNLMKISFINNSFIDIAGRSGLLKIIPIPKSEIEIFLSNSIYSQLAYGVTYFNIFSPNNWKQTNNYNNEI